MCCGNGVGREKKNWRGGSAYEHRRPSIVGVPLISTLTISMLIIRMLTIPTLTILAPIISTLTIPPGVTWWPPPAASSWQSSTVVPGRGAARSSAARERMKLRALHLPARSSGSYQPPPNCVCHPWQSRDRCESAPLWHLWQLWQCHGHRHPNYRPLTPKYKPLPPLPPRGKNTLPRILNGPTGRGELPNTFATNCSLR